jgi:hypothetical protein
VLPCPGEIACAGLCRVLQGFTRLWSRLSKGDYASLGCSEMALSNHRLG